jgi:hypothetical protein
MYWATAQKLNTEFTAAAKEVILHANVKDGQLAVPNISGIVSLGHTTDVTSVTAKNGTYTVAHNHNADGTPATRALTEAEAKKKKETIEAVKSGLAAGEKFEDLYTKYSEMKKYENGYYYSVDASYVSTLFNKMAAETSKIEVGATTLMEEESGTYIIKRLENTEGDWKNEKFADFFHDFESIASLAAFAQYIEPYMSQITVNTEKIGAYSIDAVVPNYSF